MSQISSPSPIVSPRPPSTTWRFAEPHQRIIEILAAYQYAQRIHIEKLAGYEMRAVQRYLQQLTEKGTSLVLRLMPDVPREASIRYLPDQYVYYLSGRGVNLAQQLGYADEYERFNPEKSFRTLAHDLCITEFHAALELALRATKHLKILFWEQRRTRLQTSVETRQGSVSVNPDALFAIADDRKPPEQSASAFVLETVLARTGKHQKLENDFVHKIRGYEEFARQGRAVAAWGVRDFRVVTTMPTTARTEKTCDTLRAQGLAFKRYWFTDYSRYSLDALAGILETAKKPGQTLRRHGTAGTSAGTPPQVRC